MTDPRWLVIVFLVVIGGCIANRYKRGRKRGLAKNVDGCINATPHISMKR